MDRRTLAAAAAVLALCVLVGCGEASRSGDPDDGDRPIDEHFGELPLPDLLDGGHGDGDHDAGDIDAMVTGGTGGSAEGDAGEIGDGSIEADSAVAPTCDADGDGDSACDGEDVCEGHDDALDGDSDAIPDGCDTCPVGLEAACDEVVWEIVLPEASHPIANGALLWAFGLVIEAQGESKTIVFDGIEPDGQPFSYDLSSGHFESFIDFVDASVPTLKGHVGMTTAGTSGGGMHIVSADSVCPVDPRSLVIRRVSVSGSMSANGHGSIRVDVHGYVEPGADN